MSGCTGLDHVPLHRSQESQQFVARAERHAALGEHLSQSIHQVVELRLRDVQARMRLSHRAARVAAGTSAELANLLSQQPFDALEIDVGKASSHDRIGGGPVYESVGDRMHALSTAESIVKSRSGFGGDLYRDAENRAQRRTS